MKKICGVCHRELGVAYHGNIIRKNFCCKKCDTFFKKHLCTNNRRLATTCKNIIIKSVEKHCSKECKDKFFNEGKAPTKQYKCTRCSKSKNYVEFRYKERGWKDIIGFYRQSYCRDCEGQWQKDKRDESPHYRLFLTARRRAKEKKLNFNITPEYVLKIWPKDNCCPIFKTQFKSGLENKKVLPTIDKIIPEKGYIKGNIVIISFVANQIKSNVVDVELFKKLYDFYKK
jgi:hypothetical protein